jgi:hypothetical protein
MSVLRGPEALNLANSLRVLSGRGRLRSESGLTTLSWAEVLAVNSTMIYCKNFCKCRNVPPAQQQKNKQKEQVLGITGKRTQHKYYQILHLVPGF